MPPSTLPKLLCLLTCLFTGITAQAGIVFQLIDIGNAGAGTQARAGFEKATAYWASQLADNITIHLQIGMSNTLGANTLGGASPTFGLVAYSSFRSKLHADATSETDRTFRENLPAGSTFSPYINRTSDNPNGALSATPYVDNDGSENNRLVRMTSANAKALKLLDPNLATVDATIQFNTNFNFDFDNSNGIDPNRFDFVAIAIHEIGHALGFFSGVDVLDQNGQSSFSEDDYTWVSPLDFTRFSTASQSAGADLDWTADNRQKYYSINGGSTVTVANAWSRGVRFGNGRQASHWRDGANLGIMDPTFAPGELGIVRPLDIQAFDVIGFDLASEVPEPSSLAIFGLLSSLTIQLARRKQLRTISPIFPNFRR
jgi:hypothetical protein